MSYWNHDISSSVLMCRYFIVVLTFLGCFKESLFLVRETSDRLGQTVWGNAENYLYKIFNLALRLFEISRGTSKGYFKVQRSRVEINLGRFEINLGWFQIILGWFQINLGWFQIILGWFQINLGRFEINLGWFKSSKVNFKST